MAGQIGGRHATCNQNSDFDCDYWHRSRIFSDGRNELTDDAQRTGDGRNGERQAMRKLSSRQMSSIA
jgi:hypothetical protein